jgi:hypothetical protein
VTFGKNITDFKNPIRAAIEIIRWYSYAGLDQYQWIDCTNIAPIFDALHNFSAQGAEQPC